MTTFRTPNLDDFDQLMTSAAQTYRELASHAKVEVQGKFIKAGHGHGSSRLYLTVQQEIMPIFRNTLRRMAAITIEFHQIHGFELPVMLHRFREHTDKIIEATLDLIRHAKGYQQLASGMKSELVHEQQRLTLEMEFGYLDGQRIPSAQRTARRAALKLLRGIYEIVRGDFRTAFDPFAVGERIGMEGSDIKSAESYLSMSGLIKATALDTDKYVITFEGIEEIEQLIESPYHATAHLPAIMSVHIGQNINSPSNKALEAQANKWLCTPKCLEMHRS